MTQERLHSGWRKSEITRAMDRLYATPGSSLAPRVAVVCAHCRKQCPALGLLTSDHAGLRSSPYLFHGAPFLGLLGPLSVFWPALSEGSAAFTLRDRRQRRQRRGDIKTELYCVGRCSSSRAQSHLGSRSLPAPRQRSYKTWPLGGQRPVLCVASTSAFPSPWDRRSLVPPARGQAIGLGFPRPAEPQSQPTHRLDRIRRLGAVVQTLGRWVLHRIQLRVRPQLGSQHHHRRGWDLFRASHNRPHDLF